MLSLASAYYVYILWSVPARRFYIGLSENIDHRLRQHNAGRSRWTKRHAGTWRVIWSRQFATLSSARKFEILLKKQKGGQGFWNLTQLEPEDYRPENGS